MERDGPVRRDDLARLLDREDEAFATCRRAVLAGAAIRVDHARPPAPASHHVPVYAIRAEHTTATGIPTLGFFAAVEALRAYGDRPVRLGAVDVADPPYHYQLFLDAELTAVIAVIGVDQRLGYRLEPGDRVLLGCEVVELVDENVPGWVRVQLTDAGGRVWSLVDKTPIFDVHVTAGSQLPVPAQLRCRVVEVLPTREADEPPLLVVSTDVDGVATDEGMDRFTVDGEQLRRVPVG
ncbi:hypothetical protein [Plantactinospora sonchi]|uniref:Uncharacterized protein n=1 Tax=Plantactinospora sonchi TaxID=1544735 RepID=A0ABU7RW78_9ACTN